MPPEFRFCPQCGSPLAPVQLAGRERQSCSTDSCRYVHWNNPTPVIAAIAERNDHVILVRSHGWPEHWFGLVSGFLEQGESPEDAVRRETEEEIGLPARIERFLGPYPFFQMNQLLLVYHVRIPDGPVVLDQSELAAYREVPVHKLRPWPQGTGPALGDWLRSRGFNPEPLVS